MSTKPAHGITVTRWIRRVLAVVLVYNLGIGIYDFTMGHLFGLISFACVLGLAAVMTYQTKVIHRVERANRPRPDYSVIARMEREVYGETFEHEGAPAAVRPQRWDGLTTHPDTTEPASLDQYVTWLRGYVKPAASRPTSTTTRSAGPGSATPPRRSPWTPTTSTGQVPGTSSSLPG